MKIFNSQTNQKENFTTQTPGVVNMYVCGPTVYDLLHVGNFRGAIVFNLMRNFLEHLGYQVNFAYNYTDVDDKIIAKAKSLNQTALEVSEHFIQEFIHDFNSLKLKPHTFNPKVSDYIPQMIEYVQKILDNNLAYLTPDGSVYLRRHRLPNPGLLSGRDINEGQSGEKNSTSDKEHEADFALWKGAKPGEPSWPTPWGLPGRPGWHLECSVMIYSLFPGQILDIHGGGIDLLFPHHENELNQCLAHGEPSLAKFWVHNNLLNMGQQKMSKSLGNIQTGREFITKHSGEVLKYIILSHHYRSVIDFSPEQIKRLTNQLGKFYQTLVRAETLTTDTQDSKLFDSLKIKALEALTDDFNTPELFGYLFEAISVFNKQPQKYAKALITLFTQYLGPVLSLFQENLTIFNKFLTDQALIELHLTTKEIEDQIQLRQEFRKNKDYQASDKIRENLVQRGINLLDLPNRTDWEIIR